MRGKESVVRDLRKIKEDSHNVLLATDPDREGEGNCLASGQFIRYRRRYSQCRITFNEITKKSVEQALAAPHPK